jgi:hypothetical protein
MDTLLDVLTFRQFLAPYALPLFYYLGALGVPFAAEDDSHGGKGAK